MALNAEVEREVGTVLPPQFSDLLPNLESSFQPIQGFLLLPRTWVSLSAPLGFKVGAPGLPVLL